MAPTSSSGEEDVASSAEAVTSGGLTVSVGAPKSGTSYVATVTVKNSSKEPASNWQVGLNLNQSTLASGSISGAEMVTINGVPVFTPAANSGVLNAGASVTFNFNGIVTGSSYAPTVVSVDGLANGAPGAGRPADGVDTIARAVATGALNVAEAYENNKLANKSDPNYALYDGLIWSAQSYIVSGTKIAFDPNVPGYAYIPVQAMAQLDAMQDSPAVASYLVTGLASCLADTNGTAYYNLKAGVLKGFVYPGPTSGTLAGGSAGSTDTFTATGAAVNGAEAITVTMKSSNDYAFGILSAGNFTSFAGYAAATKKFTGGSSDSCSPFNGPGGGTTNPLLVMTLNGSPLSGRILAQSTQCQNGCTSTMVVDPDAYATVGAFFNAAGLVGPQPNPFLFDPTVTAATIDHVLQWASSTDLNGNIIYGTFSSAVVHRGIITGFAWVQH